MYTVGNSKGINSYPRQRNWGDIVIITVCLSVCLCVCVCIGYHKTLLTDVNQIT